MLLLLELKILLSGSADAVVSLLVLRSRAASQGAESQMFVVRQTGLISFFLKHLLTSFSLTGRGKRILRSPGLLPFI